MQDLRIVGVNAEGENPQLLLSDEAGAEYALAIDEALKAAVTPRHSAAPQQRSGESATTPFAPREIQARLRAGATVAEVVEASGRSEQHVLRYAGPVADERAYYASRARGTVVARASTAENHRLAFGDGPAVLEDMVNVRLRAVGVKPHTITWDAWRREDGLWAVEAHFEAASSAVHAEAIGQQPPAEWVFDPAARTVRAVNKWAETLSSLPPVPSTQRTGRRLAAVDEPFDVDHNAAAGQPSAAGSQPTPARSQPGARGAAAAGKSGGDGADHEDLLDILRARRGQRLGSDESGDDKLATLLTREEHPGDTEALPLRAVQNPADNAAEGDAPQWEDRQQQDDDGEQDTTGTDAWGFSYSDSGDDDSADAADPVSAKEPEPAPGAAASKKKSPSRRPTMPRWDDILFGSKND